ncbi:hypothetical protein [Spiroplasma clarkii]|nr:hypothetical protein [Spiroplasma clarkii]
MFLTYYFIEIFDLGLESYDSISKNHEFLMEFNFNKINWILWFCLTFILTLNSLLSLGNVKRDIFKENYGFKSLVKWYLNYFLVNSLMLLVTILLFYLSTMGIFIQHWVFYLQICGYLFIFALTSYTFVSLTAYLIYVVSDFKIFIITSSLFCFIISPLLSTLPLNSVEFKNLSKTYSYNFDTNDYQLDIKNSDLIYLNSFLNENNLIFLNFDKAYSVVTSHVKKFCVNSINVVLVNNEIYNTCIVEKTVLNEAFNDNANINIIWKNSIFNKDTLIKYGDIISWFQTKGDLKEKLAIISDLFSDYDFQVDFEALQYVVYEINIDKDFGFNFGDQRLPPYYDTQLQIFAKVIFYYYLINYMKNPGAYDQMTKLTYGKVFERFLTSQIYETRHFRTLVNELMWELPEKNSEQYQDLQNQNYSLGDINLFFKENYNPILLIGIINEFKVDQNQMDELKKFKNKVKENYLFNFFAYNNSWFNQVNLDYQGKYLSILKENSYFAKKQPFYLLENNLFLNKDNLYLYPGKIDHYFWILIIIYLFIIFSQIGAIWIFSRLKLKEKVHSRSFPIII